MSISSIKKIFSNISPEWWVVIVSTIASILATLYSFHHGYIIAYGDAESHLNIAKRVIDGLTPGLAQLGGIWLPLPHLLLVPFVHFDILWRTGLAGSIVSGIAFIISSLYIYKLVFLITKDKLSSFFGALIFITNPNILYMQSTPMTELTLIVFFILSSYYFIFFLHDDKNIINLLLAAFFAFCASLSRYDGWALVLMEAGVLFLFYFPYWDHIRNFYKKITQQKYIDFKKASWGTFEGYLVIFCSLAFFGIFLWFMWGWLILGDPLYFTHSQYSANSQQHSWLTRGELPAYHNLPISTLYYFITSITNIGLLISFLAILGLIWFAYDDSNKNRWLIILTLGAPFFFNVLTLFIGQSVIFIPSLTPSTFEWTLFNVRYGIMVVPFAAFCLGYLFSKTKWFIKFLIIIIFVIQCIPYTTGQYSIITLDDGLKGLSSGILRTPDSQIWLNQHYDYGMVLTDDYTHTTSIVRSPITLNNVIYIGNKPYWEESLVAPEKYARWIIMEKGDAIWQNIMDQQKVQTRLYKYFNEVYSSGDMFIFKKI